jgi:hypothetical protein
MLLIAALVDFISSLRLLLPALTLPAASPPGPSARIEDGAAPHARKSAVLVLSHRQDDPTPKPTCSSRRDHQEAATGNDLHKGKPILEVPQVLTVPAQLNCSYPPPFF